MDIKTPPTFTEQVRAYLEFINHDRGPYGLKITVLNVTKKMGKKGEVELFVEVVDRHGHPTGNPGQTFPTQRLLAGDTLTVAELAKAFTITTNY